MWQSMQSVIMRLPIFSAWGWPLVVWHVRHFGTYSATSRCGWWTSWQVEQDIVGLERKHFERRNSPTWLPWTSGSESARPGSETKKSSSLSPGRNEKEGTLGFRRPEWQNAQPSILRSLGKRAGLRMYLPWVIRRMRGLIFDVQSCGAVALGTGNAQHVLARVPPLAAVRQGPAVRAVTLQAPGGARIVRSLSGHRYSPDC